MYWIGGWGFESNREIVFVSFRVVRARRSCVRARDDVPPGGRIFFKTCSGARRGGARACPSPVSLVSLLSKLKLCMRVPFDALRVRA